MKATETGFLDFLKKSDQFAIPIYQRTYSWVDAQCRQLWDDILRAGENDDIAAHFVGSIVYIESHQYQVTGAPPLLVIDGQQRLTTVTLIIEALARHVGDGEPVDGFSAKKVRHYYILNDLEEGERRYKLLLTQTDKQTLMAMVEQQPLPADASIRLKTNLEYFERRVRELGGAYEALCQGLRKLMVVDIALSRGQDNPQLIFESMNSTGLDLSQADLIRNFVLMGLDVKHQTRLYNNHWRPMEVAFGQEAYGKHFDSFMRHYLTVKTGEIPNVKKVYEAFKAYARTPKVDAAGVDALVTELQVFAGYYSAMALGREPNSSLASVFRDLREFKVEVAYPLLLELYQDYSAGLMSADGLEQAVRLVESYVFRRAVCGIPTNSLNRTFATFSSALRKDRYLESIKAHFLLLPSYRRFPSDDEFRREIKSRNLYNFRNGRSYWLRRMENHDRKEDVAVGEYTIEHILPQNADLSQDWREELGDDWMQVRETLLHTLGNLTLTGYNPELSDRPFAEKRDMTGGFQESPLRMNEGLGQVQRWNEGANRSRASRLADKAARVWGFPVVQKSVLDDYRANPAVARSSTIEDHAYLAAGRPPRSLFDSFRRDVLAFDACVSEVFLKHYIAYRAETNFVDVIPQVRRLRLSLNLEYIEIHDPRGFARNVTSVGHLGNGDVEVDLDASEDLPYVLGLVRQAFEKQMDNGEDDA